MERDSNSTLSARRTSTAETISRENTSTKLSNKHSIEQIENSIQGIAITGSDLNINESASSIGNEVKDKETKNRAAIFRKKSTESVTPSKKYIKEKRLTMIEKLIVKLQDPKRGIEIKSRKKMFKTFYSCFTGADLVEWFSKRCKFLLREEGLRLSQIFLIEGYIINLSNEEKPFDFSENDFYCFQAQEYWPSSDIEPSDEEYLVHLATFHYMDDKESAQIPMDKLEKLKTRFANRWPEFDALSKERAKSWKAMEKESLKLAMVREKAYWAIHRNEQIAKSQGEADDEPEYKIGFQTVEEWLLKFPADQRLIRLEKRIEQYKTSANMSRTKLSVTIKNMIARYEIYAKLDPLVSHGLRFNPFIDNPSGWISEDPNEVTPHDIRVWSLGFKDLLQDPKGLRMFEKFLKTEFSTENIYFWEKLIELENTENRKDYEETARSIYKEFICLGSKNELNINASLRTAITKKIEANQIEEYMYSDAKDAIFLLMSKDSYQRFMQSPFFKPTTSY